MPRSLPLLPSRTRWALAAAVALLVTAASLVPGAVLAAVFGEADGGALAGVDLVAHVLGYSAVTAAVAHALEAADRAPVVVVGGAALAALALGTTIEVVQPLVGRDFSVADLAANAVGAGIAAVLWRSGHRWLVLERTGG